jgi:NitT/TauT family transport system permease protein
VIVVIVRYFPLLLLLGVWEAASQLGLIDPSLLPAFSSVARSLWRLLTDPEVYYHAASSLLRLCGGLGLAIPVGIVLGIGMARSRAIRVIFNPLVQTIYPLPKSALIPVMIMWLGLGQAAKITLIFLGCLLPIVLSAYNAAKGVDLVLIWSAQNAGAGRGELLREIILPAAMPEILAGVRTALALSFVLLVSSEFLMARDGLGYLIAFLGEGGIYDAMFAAVILVTALGFFADRLYLAFMQRMLVWRG